LHISQSHNKTIPICFCVHVASVPLCIDSRGVCTKQPFMVQIIRVGRFPALMICRNEEVVEALLGCYNWIHRVVAAEFWISGLEKLQNMTGLCHLSAMGTGSLSSAPWTTRDLSGTCYDRMHHTSQILASCHRLCNMHAWKVQMFGTVLK
jgi:hypothetical protein